MFRGKTDLEGKLAETIMLSNDNDAFENYSKSLDEHSDVESDINTEADIFSETDSKVFLSLTEMIMVNEVELLTKRSLDMKVKPLNPRKSCIFFF